MRPGEVMRCSHRHVTGLGKYSLPPFLDNLQHAADNWVGRALALELDECQAVKGFEEPWVAAQLGEPSPQTLLLSDVCISFCQYLPNLLFELFCLRRLLGDNSEDSRQEEITLWDGDSRFFATQKSSSA